VRTALITTGLKIGSTPPVETITGTVASWSAGFTGAISARTKHLLTRAAIPYRDPHLDSTDVILHRRQQEQCLHFSRADIPLEKRLNSL